MEHGANIDDTSRGECVIAISSRKTCRSCWQQAGNNIPGCSCLFQSTRRQVGHCAHVAEPVDQLLSEGSDLKHQ